MLRMRAALLLSLVVLVQLHFGWAEKSGVVAGEQMSTEGEVLLVKEEVFEESLRELQSDDTDDEDEEEDEASGDEGNAEGEFAPMATTVTLVGVVMLAFLFYKFKKEILDERKNRVLD